MKTRVREAKLVYKGRGRESVQITTPEHIYQFIKRDLGDATTEQFIVLLLNNKNYIIGWTEVSKGSISESLVHPREVFATAIHSLASSVIIVHNHPSGSLVPSREDLSTTKRIYDASKIIGIELLDHLIISNDGFYSFKEHNQIGEVVEDGE